MEQLLYGVAYYDEYMKEDRLEQDMRMMERAGINVIRIAESTWASEEPREGVFNFQHVKRSIEAAGRHNISVIVGTPTYAIPPWMVRLHPEIIAKTEDGQGKYGARQNMDITNPHYLFYAERIIRKLLTCVQDYPNVIGFQIDNETKHYHVAGEAVQKRFKEYLKDIFGSTEHMNREFGLAYWSNAVDDWEYMPDVTGTINGSLLAEFEKFRRMLVEEFLLWQRGIIEEYRREDQFVTHNFDFEWRDYSFGLQPDVNHFRAAGAVTIAGCDIYHKTQDLLTGKEAAFCGAVARSLKQKNYLVLETQAQGHIGWTPYDGQLRMQTFSHLANGADGVLYWHWHSIHNSFETYWRGLLSHDLEENRLYREAMTIGRDFGRIGEKLLHLNKQNKVAILLSNESLTAVSRLPMFPLPDTTLGYNDIARAYADALYECNVDYDIVAPDRRDFSSYDLLVVPLLYSAEDALLESIEDYVSAGGTLLATFKSAYANEFLTVSHDKKPHILHKCFGMSYQEYTIPVNTALQETKAFREQNPLDIKLTDTAKKVSVWMELLIPEAAEVLAHYAHPYWKQYAAITENTYGQGRAIYAGCHLTQDYVKRLVSYVADKAGVLGVESCYSFPVHIQSGRNQYGKYIHYYFNYSQKTQYIKYLHENGIELLSGRPYQKLEPLELLPWSVVIIEEENKS